MRKALVAYWSFSGVTAEAAKKLAEAEGADLFEIIPETPYTAEDIDYTNKQSRSTLEMSDLSCRPAIANKVDDMGQYDLVFIGFPLWWSREPSIIDTFLDAYDFTGKKVVPFCTSGGGGVKGAADRFRELLGDAVTVDDGKRLGGEVSVEELKVWTAGLDA